LYAREQPSCAALWSKVNTESIRTGSGSEHTAVRRTLLRRSKVPLRRRCTDWHNRADFPPLALLALLDTARPACACTTRGLRQGLHQQLLWCLHLLLSMHPRVPVAAAIHSRPRPPPPRAPAPASLHYLTLPLLLRPRCNDRGAIGFVSDPRRLNVAITRPRRGLVLVGSPSTLQRGSRDWAQYTKWAQSNKVVVGLEQLLGNGAGVVANGQGFAPQEEGAGESAEGGAEGQAG
jgi:hypothetical protein